MKIHELRCLPMFYGPLANGAKTFELRFDDRAFRVGDTIVLNEYKFQEGYTGRSVSREITYILYPDDLPDALYPGWVCLGLLPVPEDNLVAGIWSAAKITTFFLMLGYIVSSLLRGH